jgi:hypothetical protein
MNTTNNIKKTVVGGLLAGGVALAGLGLTTGIASAAPSQHAGDGSVRVADLGASSSGDGSVRVVIPAATH